MLALLQKKVNNLLFVFPFSAKTFVYVQRNHLEKGDRWINTKIK